MTTQTRQIPKLHTRAAFIPETFSADNRTVEVTFSTGSQVRRFDFWTEKEWIEELSLDSRHVNLDRLNSGAPLLSNHNSDSLKDVVGVVDKAWLKDGEGRALVRFSDREEIKPVLNDVKSGILRNISIGYQVNTFEQQDERQDDLTVYRAVDWEPMEISLVTIPADAGAQVRSDGENHSVQIINRIQSMKNKQRGESLISALEGAISSMETEETPRSEIISSMGSAAGIESGTVSQILSGGIDCPPLDRLEGFASALDGVSIDDLVSAAEQDGCEYADNDDGSRSLKACGLSNENNEEKQMKEKQAIGEIKAQAAKDERTRVAEIRKFGKISRVDEKTIDGLIERGVSVADAKDTMLKDWSEKVDKETSRSDASVTTDEKDKFIEAGVNALLGRAGVQKMEGANEMRGMRLTEIAKLCLQRSGVSATGVDEHTMIKRAFNMDRSITQSTSDFPVLLENAMHKVIQDAYTLASLTWNRFCATGSVTDFRAHNRYRLGSFGNLDALNEAGEFKNKSIPDGEKAVITASTKGNLINITRQTIINDDLGAFIALAQMLARAAGRTVEADVYALLVSNPVLLDGIALFHASHNNLAGAGTAVTVADIEAGRVAMAKQTDVSDNDFLDLRPNVWVGGMSTGGEARVVNDAQYDDDSSKNQNKPNKVRGLFSDIVDSPRITGSDWYMFADASDAPVLEVAFLNGEQAPFLDSMDAFNVDGLQWKVRLDYGVAAIDYRGAYRNPGV